MFCKPEDSGNCIPICQVQSSDPTLAVQKIDPQLNDLLRRMLTKDPEKRATAEEVCQHPWLKTAHEKQTAILAAKRKRREQKISETIEFFNVGMARAQQCSGRSRADNILSHRRPAIRLHCPIFWHYPNYTPSVWLGHPLALGCLRA